jgi:DNA-binding phage protein
MTSSRRFPPQSAHRKSNAELLAPCNLGKNGRFFDGADFIELLRQAVVREGGISAFAKRAGLHRADIHNTLKGRRPVSRTLVKVLGLRKVYTAE